MTGDLRTWIVEQHGWMRVAYDLTMSNVPKDRFTDRPAHGGNSVAWLLWHIARCEDVAINTVVRGEPQVFVRDGWMDRIRVAEHRVGTGLSDEEVDGFNAAADADSIEAYWKAVQDLTSGWLQTVDLATLDEAPPVDERLASVPAIVGAPAAWLPSFWRGQPGRWFVHWVTNGHGFWHIGEMDTVRRALGFPGA